MKQDFTIAGGAMYMPVDSVIMTVIIPVKSKNPLEDIKKFLKRDYYQNEDIYAKATIVEYGKVISKCLNGLADDTVYDDIAYKFEKTTRQKDSKYWTEIPIEKYMQGTAGFITPTQRSKFTLRYLRDPMIVAAMGDMLIEAIRKEPMDYDFTPLGKYLMTKDDYV